MYIYVKRFIDIVLSIAGLILLFPLLLLIAIVIKLESPGPVFFKQERAGIHKKSFYIYKFRTMRLDTPPNTPTWMLDDADLYITNIGKMIRRRSIDELPQLINVLKGEMSLIGPRPVVWTEKDLINEREKRNVYSVLPGLTGWAQINGRDELENFDKAYLDGEYVESISFYQDIKIFLGTVAYVLKMDGVVEGLRTTTENINSKRVY